MQENTTPENRPAACRGKPLWQPKEMLIFLLVAFGMPFLMGIPLAIDQRAGYNTDVFPNAQMFYPAAGVMLALFPHPPPRPARGFYVFYLLCTAALVVCLPGYSRRAGDVWLGAVNILVVAGSALAWLFCSSPKKTAAPRPVCAGAAGSRRWGMWRCSSCFARWPSLSVSCPTARWANTSPTGPRPRPM